MSRVSRALIDRCDVGMRKLLCLAGMYQVLRSAHLSLHSKVWHRPPTTRSFATTMCAMSDAFRDGHRTHARLRASGYSGFRSMAQSGRWATRAKRQMMQCLVAAHLCSMMDDGGCCGACGRCSGLPWRNQAVGDWAEGPARGQGLAHWRRAGGERGRLLGAMVSHQRLVHGGAERRHR